MFEELEVSDDEEEIVLLTNKFKRFLKSKESQRERRICWSLWVCGMMEDPWLLASVGRWILCQDYINLNTTRMLVGSCLSQTMDVIHSLE